LGIVRRDAPTDAAFEEVMLEAKRKSAVTLVTALSRFITSLRQGEISGKPV
jgi:hypothetical protein